MTRIYERFAGLPLAVDKVAIEGLSRRFPGGFTRLTSVVRLFGGGEEGQGEDVTYDDGDQRAFQSARFSLPLSGRYTLGEFSSMIGRLDLFPRTPRQEDSRHYRRWAFESAATDLALRQAGRSFAELLGRTPHPLRFIASPRLGQPPTFDPIERWLARYPGLRFKLDATSSWDAALIERLASTRAVEVIDLKGAYRGTPVDQPPDAGLYSRVVAEFPETWIEDPATTPETEAVLANHRARITWDAPIHSVADIEALPFPPRMLNVKPSRFGTLAALLDAYDHCAARNIRLYGGGQFELGPGRDQIQLLAALFHPDAPNDVAPGGFNGEPGDGLPVSPLVVRPSALGFGRAGA